jgi:hypothetical protein
MVAYSFKEQFVAPILAGTKCQTIRADRKRHARAGDELQLYTGMRTKQCRLIGRATCLGAVPARLNFASNCVEIGGAVFHGWEDLSAFAKQDGFEDWLMMRDFWRDRNSFDHWTGILIRWGGFRRAYPPEWPPGPPPRGQHDA